MELIPNTQRLLKKAIGEYRPYNSFPIFEVIFHKDQNTKNA
jgi:hypothetical protein